MNGKSKKRSTSPKNDMFLRKLSAEQAAVAQHDSFGAIAFCTLLCRRCYNFKGIEAVTSLSAVPIIVGRVSSIVNYDTTYGKFLPGFANLCAVSTNLIYNRPLPC